MPKSNNTAFIATGIMALLLMPGFLVATVAAQESTTQQRERNETDKPEEISEVETAIEEAKAAFAQIASLLDAERYEEATALMDPEAVHEFVAEPFLNAIMMASMDLEMEMEIPDDVPDEFREEMEAEMEKMEVMTATFKELITEFELEDFQPDEDMIDQKEFVEFGKEVVSALDEKGTRWQAYKKFREANADEYSGTFHSEIVDSEAGDDVVYLELKPEFGDMMMGPNIGIAFKKNEGSWIFAGVDAERTEDLMEDFIEEMENMEFEGEEWSGEEMEEHEHDGDEDHDHDHESDGDGGDEN